MRHVNTKARCFALALTTLAAGAGCMIHADSDAPADPAGVNFTIAAEVAAAWGTALQDRDTVTYARLLEPPPPSSDPGGGFVFYPPPDVADFPWLAPGEPWGLEQEFSAIGHLMDPGFVSSRIGSPINRVRVVLHVLSERETADGTEVQVRASIEVSWAADEGVLADTRLIMLMAPDAEGHLRIRSMREEAAGSLRIVTRVTWSGIKNLFV